MKVEPNPAKHQQIIFDVCKKHNVKSLELTDRHIAIMDDCITAALESNPPTQEPGEGKGFPMPVELYPGYYYTGIEDNGVKQVAFDPALLASKPALIQWGKKITIWICGRLRFGEVVRNISLTDLLITGYLIIKKKNKPQASPPAPDKWPSEESKK